MTIARPLALALMLAAPAGAETARDRDMLRMSCETFVDVFRDGRMQMTAHDARFLEGYVWGLAQLSQARDTRIPPSDFDLADVSIGIRDLCEANPGTPLVEIAARVAEALEEAN